MRYRIWIETLAIALTIVALAASTGCATSTEKLLTHDSRSMLEIWNQQTGGGASGGPTARQLLDARLALRRPLTEADKPSAATASAPYTRTAQNEIQRQFQRLPNPDLLMYVFPHLAGTDPVPVPGYSTVFPLHRRVHYALPGERVEGY